MRVHSSSSVSSGEVSADGALPPEFFDGDDRAPDIEVVVTTDRSPRSEVEPLYDKTGWLSVQSDGDGYRLGVHCLGEHMPHTIAYLDRRATRAKIYVGQCRDKGGGGAETGEGLLGSPLLRLLLMTHLGWRGGVVIHAAGAAFAGRVLVFPGVSDSGKSTLAAAIQDAGLGACLLSDERIIVRTEGRQRGNESGFEAWGGPWASDAGVARNVHKTLGGLFFPVKAETDEVVRISPAQAMKALMPTVSYPWFDEQAGRSVLETCGSIVEEVPCHELRFTPGRGVVDLLTAHCRRAKGRRTAEGCE